MDTQRRSADDLLAWINHRLELVSSAQHDLALQKTVLREQATRLRLGVEASEVEVVLRGRGLAPTTPSDSVELDDARPALASPLTRTCSGRGETASHDHRHAAERARTMWHARA